MNLYSTSQANGDGTHHSVSNCVRACVCVGSQVSKISLGGGESITVVPVDQIDLRACVCMGRYRFPESVFSCQFFFLFYRTHSHTVM